MRVHVKLMGDVRRHLRGRAEPLEVVLLDGAVVADALHALNIPENEPIVVGVNGQVGDLTSPLTEGDSLTLVTPMAGGA